MLDINLFNNESNNFLEYSNCRDFLNLEEEYIFSEDNSIQDENNKKIIFVSKKEEEIESNLLKKKHNHNSNEKFTLKNYINGRWTKEEQILFADAIIEYGDNWKKIQEKFSTRNNRQIRSHAQKFLMKLKENSYLKKKASKKIYVGLKL